MITAKDALERLLEGNRRFASSAGTHDAQPSRRRPIDLASGQQPFAIILGCSDSRVAPEIVFGQDLGDLFVIRIAGNIVTPALLGSIEFAVAQFGTPLVVVLGHSQCGAILATLKLLQQSPEEQSANLRLIVDSLRPSIEELLKTELAHDTEALVDQAVRANIRVSMNNLRSGSEILDQQIRSGALAVVGAEYSLETGMVDFFADTAEG